MIEKINKMINQKTQKRKEVTCESFDFAKTNKRQSKNLSLGKPWFPYEKSAKKRVITSLIIIIFVLTTSFIITAQTQPAWPAFNVCCERTNNEAWCQNAPTEFCNEDYRTTPTSCEATSFCKLGCCVDSDEGLCTKNTPQKVCEVSTGTWLEDEQCNVPQCALACCLLGDQASFVTLTRCKRLSSIYGLETDFRREVTSEAACIDLAYTGETGACVYEVEFQKTCTFTTRAACLGSSADESKPVDIDAKFYKDFLCSADELATDCGPTKETTCVEGKDEVYFIDSCGNPANIYDSRRVYSKDPAYWRNVVPKQETCGYNDKKGNMDSKECGNCEYLQGSLCGEGDANEGDYVCKDLNCYNTINGNSYRNGESWCVYQGTIDNGDDLVGSRHFRHICIHGEETVEACADFRNEICIEEEFGTVNGNFIEAACRINRWEDCLIQYEEDDCLNLDKRECFWAEGVHYDGSGGSGKSTSIEDKTATRTDVSLGNVDEKGENQGILNNGSICLPNNPPGLNFWEAGEAATVCALGNSKQLVHFETDLFGTKKCKENCEVLEAKWVQKMNHVCRSLGDCGSYMNIAGKFTNKGAVWKSNGQRKVLDGILGGLQDAGTDGGDTTSISGQTDIGESDSISDNTIDNTVDNTMEDAQSEGEEL